MNLNKSLYTICQELNYYNYEFDKTSFETFNKHDPTLFAQVVRIFGTSHLIDIKAAELDYAFNTLLRDKTLLAASVILPLADDLSQLGRSMGTRHRAALGISQITDSLIIVVSEETGKVSIARDGIITRGIKIDRFRGIIRSIYNPPKIKKSFKLLDWFKR